MPRFQICRLNDVATIERTPAYTHIHTNILPNVGNTYVFSALIDIYSRKWEDSNRLNVLIISIRLILLRRV